MSVHRGGPEVAGREPERYHQRVGVSQFVILAVDPAMNGETAWLRN